MVWSRDRLAVPFIVHLGNHSKEKLLNVLLPHGALEYQKGRAGLLRAMPKHLRRLFKKEFWVLCGD
jgi:hypothetical protein